MEGIFNVLKDLQKVIDRGLINFKKSPKDRLTLEFIQIKLELLQKNWDLFKENYTKMREKYSVQEDVLVEIYDSTEDTYVTHKCLMQSLLKKFACEKQADTCHDKSGSSKTNLAKLPKITIPNFSGKYSEWTTFRDLFTSLVHNNASLDNVQKMHYLKSHLTGEAEQLVRHTPVSDSNYVQCWSQLEKRYSNKKYLVNCILKRLFSQKRMHVESATSLKELLDTTNDCLSALANLDVNVTTWDVIIIHIVTFKLDSETRKQWELQVSGNDSNELPTFKQFSSFIETRFRALECIEPKRVLAPQVNTSHISKALVAVSSSHVRCEYCSEKHKLCFCKKFAKHPVNDRREFVAKHKLCFNCMGSNHMVTGCKKQTTCKLCNKRHHSLLHLNEAPPRDDGHSSKQDNVDTNSPNSGSTVVSCFSKNMVMPRQVLLATALVKAESKTGDYHVVRALIDQGSQACFITESTVQYLRLQKIPVRGVVSGLGSGSVVARFMVRLNIQSRVDPQFQLNLNAYVLKKLTSTLPDKHMDKRAFNWVAIAALNLADPHFDQPNRVDLLLGAEVYSIILKNDMVKSPSSTLIAQNTALGWILSGAVNSPNKVNVDNTYNNIQVMHAQFREDDLLKQFWEIEEQQIDKGKLLTPEEQRCEEFYKNTTKRREDGRYVVKLPFKVDDPPCKAGGSRVIAEARLKALERRLHKNQDLKQRYTEVINEYLRLGHMKPVYEKDIKKDIAVYLPHHAVIRDDKTTTKVRVVFNASEKNRNGISLNDTLMVGPTLQVDLRHTVLKWRLHPIGLVADIVKMYRQVYVANDDTMFQRILWRDDPTKDIKDYELVTVTFGTASAPYQAVRTLHQLVYDEGEKYPLVADKILNEFYMDDLMTGCASVSEGVAIYKQMKELLGKGGFKLQKWNTNNKELLAKISSMEERNENNKIENNNTKHIMQKEDKEVAIKLNNTIKILGLTWDRSEDTFQYSVNLPTPTTVPLTKRLIISDIARLYDPLGWLAPAMVLAKIFIQKLWLAGVGWDDVLSTELVNEWSTYRKELCLLTSIRIPRWLGNVAGDDLELHGFCDASKVAYSAVVYLRTVDIAGKVHISLLVARTRVAPIKQVSIPRLELCGAVLLSKLLAETARVLNIRNEKITAWTDSTVVLAWLGSHPSRWKTFVANRTSEILITMQASQWFHVSTKNNPADCASRGLLPSLLVENRLWFSGPLFLKEKIITYPKSTDSKTELEHAVKTLMVTAVEPSPFERFSTLQRLLRVIAYCRRFMKKGQNKGCLKHQEIDEALECCIKVTQKQTFEQELKQIQELGHLKMKASKLKALCPYLDHKGVMRAQGRIEKAPLEEQIKHPIVLPKTEHFTQLLVADAHRKTLHGGSQVMLNYLRKAYWIIGVRQLVKLCIRKCVTCAKQRAQIQNPMMGSLPSVRCSPTRPFQHSGVDYAGPINIRTTKGRGHRAYKGYICVFVCMSTRAIHLEVVSDMSSQAFMAAFRRFVSRRGHCAKLWSDNGTTFVGASRELQELTKAQPAIVEHLEANGTEWHFIPPHAPNFGGLWEAGVKSTKFHLKRVVGESTLTYEELSTFLTQVEACLNSRPISVVTTDDPGEPMPLTPGHFLVGEPLINVPDYNHDNSNISSLTRWQFVQRMVRSFWSRWSQEYLANLMNRYKWTAKIPEPKIGDIVLIKDDDLPPSRWLLGRVLEKHPGHDNVTRVVTLRTKGSTIKRPTNKVCILPVAD